MVLLWCEGEDWRQPISYNMYFKACRTQKSNKKNHENLVQLKESVLKEIPKQYENYESILGEPLFINNFKFTKFLKKNFIKMIKNPNLFFDKSKRNIKLSTIFAISTMLC